MEEIVKNSIRLLAEKIKAETKSEDALRFTQAALNLAHVLGVQTNIDETRQRMKNSG